MPVRLAELASRTKKTSADFDGDTVNMEVRYLLITPRLMADLVALDRDSKDPEKAADALLSMSQQVVRLIASWDMLDVDDTMYPLDVARLQAEIPAALQLRVLFAATAVMSAGEAKAAADSVSAPTSAATSSQTAS